MKKSLAILLVIILPLIAFAVSAGAALPPVVFGDVNGDFSADVLDVTLIQRYLAELEAFSYEKEIRADFDHDGSVTSIDASKMIVATIFLSFIVYDSVLFLANDYMIYILYKMSRLF